MEAEQFSLCWNNFHNNLSSGFHSLLQDEDLVDVTLAAEGRYIKAHKMVLSVCSPYFKELFRVNPCKHPIVILQDVNYAALSSLMQFMYQGEVSVSQDEIPAFMKVAETLKIKGLTESSTNAEVNGIVNSTPNRSNSPCTFASVSEFRPNSQVMKRTRPIKKIIKPVTNLRPIELSPLKSPPPLKSPQPPVKKPCLDKNSSSTNYTETPIKPKQEPIDDYKDHYDESLDVSSMLDTSLSEPSPSQIPNWSSGFDSSKCRKSDFKGSADMSSPGTLQCILGKRGNPRLIVDGYTFYKKSTYKGKSFWYCKHSRSTHKCSAVCWTLNGNIVKWPSYHTHEVVPDTFNPEDDTEVPIKHLHEVLLQTAMSG